MKLRRWSKVVVWMTAAFMAGSVLLLIAYFGWNTILTAWKDLCVGEWSWREALPLLLIPATVFLLIAVSVVNIVLGICFTRKVMRPLEKAVAFAEALSRNETPEMLMPSPDSDEDVAALQISLNVLRDRQQNQLVRNRQSAARAARAGRERDRFESLKRRAFDIILPDARRALGILKGQLLIQLAEMDKIADPGKKYYRDLLVKSIRRQGALARDMEAAVDVNRLDWKRWNDPVPDRFDTADFLYDLLESARVVARSREVLLVSELSSDIPGRLYADRELLAYLLSVLLRAACRLAAPASEVVFKGTRDERGELFFELHLSLRENASPETEEDALDIALEIVRQTASVVGCEIAVEMRQKNGCFRLSLPAGASIYDRAGITALPTMPLFSRAPSAVDDRLLEVLLLDGEPEGAEVLAKVMQSYHQELTVVRTEAELLEKLREKSFDAAIVTSPFADRAPGALIADIRSVQTCPVVLISPAFPDEDGRKLDFAGHTAYLTMPLNYELLNEVIRRMCR